MEENINDKNKNIALFILAIIVVGSAAFFAGRYIKNMQDSSPLSASSNSSRQSAQTASQTSAATQAIMDEINPPEGYEINATYGDIGPKMIASGVIDLDKFKQTYERARQPLTQDQLDILTKGSNAKIKITPENSYFLLNFLWAAGLANKNKILDTGPMQTSGTSAANFASTGGWSLSKTTAMDYYSKFSLTPALTPSQQKTLEDFANNAYRPCCGNSTAFPDCNHGMAMLGLGEIMASQGASSEDMFNAFKYVNAFWFPQTYFDIATYFKEKDGKDYKDVDSRTIAGADYSSGRASLVESWLTANNLKQQPPSGGGSCGV